MLWFLTVERAKDHFSSKESDEYSSEKAGGK
jgi:hypothetical protein